MKDLKIISLPDSKRTEEEAAEWIMRLHDGDCSETELAEFMDWRSDRPQNEQTFERLSKFWSGFEIIECLEDYAASDAAVDSLRQDHVPWRMGMARNVLAGSIAASILIILSFVVVLNFFSGTQNFTDAYETAVGEQERVNLPDGSQIILNSNSAARIAYSHDARVIVLSRGEAYFDVAPNHDRPFSVETGKGVVTAVGTAFSVSLTAENLDVVVEEGRITFARPKKSKVVAGEKRTSLPPPTEISAGQAAILGESYELISTVKPETIEKRLDWRDGELAFNGETLEEVINVLSIYTDLTIEISDKDLRQERIVAYYKIGDVDRIFEALNVMADVQVEYISDRHIRLSRSP